MELRQGRDQDAEAVVEGRAMQLRAQFDCSDSPDSPDSRGPVP